MEKLSSRLPLVTVLTLVYNTGKYMSATFDSIRNQTYKNIEHIIIDDGSIDGSPELVRKWIDDNNWKCTFIVNLKNKGISANLNYMLRELTNGDYVALIGDDVMMPTKIEDDVAFLEANPSFMFCYSKMINFDVLSEIETFPPYTGSDNPFHDYLITGKPIIPTPSIFYRREIFAKVDYYDERYMCEDFDMILKVTYKYPVGFRDAFSIKYIVHPGSMTVSKVVKLNTELLTILDEKWSFLPKFALYRDRRYFNVFCLFARDYKKEALKYLVPSLRFFYTRLFIRSVLVLLFSWPRKQKK